MISGKPNSIPGTRVGFPAAAVRWSVVIFAAYALIAGGLTLTGWFAALPRLTDWIASGISMLPNAALAAVGSGAALILAMLNRRRSARLSGILGWIVLLLGTATLFQHLSGVDLGIDTMLVKPAWGERAAVAPGRMGPPASASFTLLGLALVLISSGRDTARRIVPALGIIVCAIAMLALMGYVSGADPLFAVAKFTGIAMQTASVLLALALAVLASVPEHEPVRTLQAHNAAGLLARRSLPFIIGLPLALGWLRVRGQEAGWVDTAMGTSLFALALVVIFCVLLCWWAAAVARHEKELAAARDLLATTLASIGDAVIATDSDGNVLFLNSEAEKLTGWKNVEASGQPLLKVFHIINEQTRQAAESPVEKVFRTGKVAGLANHTLLVSRDGTETPIDDSAAPIRELDSPLFGVVLVFRDVTEQRKAQQAASRLAAVVEHSGDAIFTKNLDGMIQTWNPSAERLFGYRAEEILGKPVTLLIPTDRLKEEDDIIGHLRQGQPVERLETIRVAKSGRRIPVALSVSPLKNGDGEVIGASKIIHDISEIVAAREALVREKELLATTLVSIGDAVIVTDSQGRITFLNAEAERLTKWSNAEAAGQPLPKVFHIVNEATRAPVENPVEKVLRVGGIVGLANHTVLIAKDGTETPIDDSAAPIRQADDPLFGVVLVFRDFSERQQAEQALRDSQERLTRLINSAMDAVIAVDAQQQITLFNPAAEEMFGCKAADAIGGSLDRFIPSRFREAHRGHIEKFGETGVTSRRMGSLMTLTGLRTNGEEFPIEASISQVEFGAQKTFKVILRDITERRRAEEALRLAKENAETANKVKDRFLATLSHELRTPLTPVLILAAEHASSRELPEEVRRDFDTIRANISLEVRLIDDLLDLTRIEQGKFRLAFTDCDVHALVHKVADLVRAELEVKQITLRLELDALSSHVEGDAARLQQVIWNVIKNAIKFTPRSGSVTLRTFNESGMLVIVISDTGVGISTENLTRIFDAFEQVEQSDAGYSGLGLGLAIAAGIVSAHHGHIRAESAGLGHGATFHILLPVASAISVPVTGPAEPIAAAPKQLRILLVEDHGDSRRSLTRMLERRGHAVAQAETGARARELAASTAFDLVISDLGLPDIDGHALMRHLRDTHGLRGIALSGYGMADDVQRSREAGFAVHLVKPVEMGALDQAIAGLSSRAPSAV